MRVDIVRNSHGGNRVSDVTVRLDLHPRFERRVVGVAADDDELWITKNFLMPFGRRLMTKSRQQVFDYLTRQWNM